MNFMNFAHHKEYILSHITYQCQLLNRMTLNLNALGITRRGKARARSFRFVRHFVYLP